MTKVLDHPLMENNIAAADREAVIEFLKTLQVLPPGTRDRIVDEKFQAREWPPRQSLTTNYAPPTAGGRSNR